MSEAKPKARRSRSRSVVVSQDGRWAEQDGVRFQLARADETQRDWIGQDEILRHLVACWLVVDEQDVPKRTTPFAMTATFDGPSGEACLAKRERSNTPLQALKLLNDTGFMECVRALGKMTATSEGDEAKRAELLFRRCLTRPPSNEEREKLVQFYRTQLARFASGELKAAELLDLKEGDRLNEEAAWAAVARVLLNLDENITKS